jgi:hypothetical protein
MGSDFVEQATAAYRARLAALVDAYGTPHAEPERLGAQAALLSAASAAWTEQIGPFVDADGARVLLAGVTRQALSQRLRAGRLLGLRTGSGRIVYPLWQFGGGGVLPGLSAVLDAAGYDPDRAATGWTLASWLCTDDPDLGGRPRDLLTAGHLTPVLAAAADVRAELGTDERAEVTAAAA